MLFLLPLGIGVGSNHIWARLVWILLKKSKSKLENWFDNFRCLTKELMKRNLSGKDFLKALH